MRTTSESSRYNGRTLVLCATLVMTSLVVTACSKSVPSQVSALQSDGFLYWLVESPNDSSPEKVVRGRCQENAAPIAANCNLESGEISFFIFQNILKNAAKSITHKIQLERGAQIRTVAAQLETQDLNFQELSASYGAALIVLKDTFAKKEGLPAKQLELKNYDEVILPPLLKKRADYQAIAVNAQAALAFDPNDAAVQSLLTTSELNAAAAADALEAPEAAAKNLRDEIEVVRTSYEQANTLVSSLGNEISKRKQAIQLEALADPSITSALAELDERIAASMDGTDMRIAAVVARLKNPNLPLDPLLLPAMQRDLFLTATAEINAAFKE